MVSLLSFLRKLQSLFSVCIFLALLPGCNTSPRLLLPSELDIDRYFQQIAASSVAPKVFDENVRANGMTELFIDGEDYQGKSTRIFALYQASATPLVLASGKMPAVVLVHGGGGTAFDVWVEKWNQAGFAAISIAVEGQTDARPDDFQAKQKNGNRWNSHLFSGPSRANIYADSAENITQQWMFHAVSAVIRAKHYLASKDEIDPKHIGISGISWGGVITSTVIGFDPNFDFAIPIYGCGFLDTMDNQYKVALEHNVVYKNIWEPGLRISRYLNPSLWLTWRKDKHFALDAQAKTYKQLTGNYSVSIKPGIGHGHLAGWTQPEPYEFAQKVVVKKNIVISTTSKIPTWQGIAEARFTLAPDLSHQVIKANVHYTDDTGHTGQANWTTAAATLNSPSDDAKNQYTATFKGLPDDVKHWFINLEIQMPDNSFELSKSFVISSDVVSL